MAKETYPTQCPRCGAPVGSLKECFTLLAGVNAKEYSDRDYAAVNHLSVDAHALQHPEDHGLKNNAFHLARLCWILEHNGSPAMGSGPRWLEESFNGGPKLPALDPPAPHRRGQYTVANILPAVPPEEHARLVKLWAGYVYEAWSQHHEWARKWLADHQPD